MKKLCSVICCALLLSVAGLFAAGNGEKAESGKSVSIKIVTWTSNQTQLDLLNSFVQEFAAKKGIAIDPVFETIPFAEYTTKLALELQSSTPPDVFWILETSAPAFIESKVLMPLNAQLASYDVSDFSPKLLELWSKNKNIYAVPFSSSPFFLLYNEDLFKAAGIPTPAELAAQGQWNWENFRKSAAAVKKATNVWGYQTVDGQGYDARVLHNLLPIIRSYGGDAWDEKNKVAIDSPESIAAVQMFHDMVFKDGSVVPPGNQSDFFAGNAAMTVAQVSRVSKLAGVSWKWGIAPMPNGPKGASPILGQAAIGAAAKGKNSALAAELVAYMTNKECVARMAGIWPPARVSVMDSKEFLSSNKAIDPASMKTAVADSLKAGRVLPSHIQFPQIAVESRTFFDKLWYADANVPAIMKEIGTVYRKYIK